MIHHRRFALPLSLAVLILGATGVVVASEIRSTLQARHSFRKIAPPPASFPLYFDPSVSYNDALRAITDLGLQPSMECGYEDDLRAGRVITHMQWQPAGQRAIFSSEHRLFVARTPLTSPDWTTRLSHVPGWLANNTPERLSQPITCPSGATGWGASPTDCASVSSTSYDTSGLASTILDYAQANNCPKARVIFTPSSTYDQALYAFSDLGLRLADICYERAQSSNYPTPVPWPGAGQEQRFAVAHDLIVTAAPLTSPIHWEQKVSLQAGVATVTVPYTASC
jgi:hypothetical protein